MNDEESTLSDVISAEAYYDRIKKYPPLQCGDKYIDNLLDGGFRKGLVHLLIGAKKTNTSIMLRAAVKSFMPIENGGISARRVAYIDGSNRFSPYFISHLATSMKMNPRKILSNIYIARAFNWSQMVELAEIKLKKMNGIDLVLIDGFTRKFEVEEASKDTLNQDAFDDLKNAINGIKKAIQVHEPIVIISAPKHEKSLHKPLGGRIITHFGCVIVEILKMERYTEYSLAQHPFLPEKGVRKWKTISEKIMARYSKWDNEQKNTEKKADKQNASGIGDQKGLSSTLSGGTKSWEELIQRTPDPEIVKEFQKLRLQRKRKSTAEKSRSDDTKNMTLDFYLNKNS